VNGRIAAASAALSVMADMWNSLPRRLMTPPSLLAPTRPWKTLARPLGSRYRHAGSFSGSTIPYGPTS
jgi:hypothetical protein